MKTKRLIGAMFGAALLLSPPADAKGPLDADTAELARNVVFPLLIKANLCKTVQDCRDHEYFFCVTWEDIACNVFGITDDKTITAILISILQSDLKVSALSFYRSSHRTRPFLEHPLVSYTNRIERK